VAENSLPTIDGWLGQLFDEDHIEDTVRTLANVEQDDLATAEKLEARRTIKDCDKRIGNFEIACGATDDPETIAGFARRIERTRSERKGAELRLRRVTTGRGLTEEEIREVVNSLTDAVALLTNASPEDRRRVYETAELEILYDHENHRAQLSVAPRVTGGVGGGT
jgi:site-specific DNA recombinase